jgi:uncharacterized membrane protein YphA (DoxX/SURF4 family)
MTTLVQSGTTAKWKTIALWTLRGLLALLFLYASLMKLSGQPDMVAEFAKLGLGQWFRFLTGTLELAGGIAILVPRTSPFGALLLLCVDAGAFVAQISVLHIDWIHTVVIGLALAGVVFMQRDRLASAR